jgi:hypothetical protein
MTTTTWRDTLVAVDLLDRDGGCIGGGTEAAGAVAARHPQHSTRIQGLAQGTRTTVDIADRHGRPTIRIRPASPDEIATHEARTAPIEQRLHALAAESEPDAAEILTAAAEAITKMRRAGADLLAEAEAQGLRDSTFRAFARPAICAARDAFRSA